MAKAVEITFAIGAALAGSFAGTFGKAGKALSDFQKQAEQMQRQSAQIESYQKMQGAIVNNATEMQTMYDKAEALNAQAVASKARTQDLSSQYRTAQQETARLTAENVRNTDAYKAAQLNVKSLEKQISASSQPTAELQRQYKAAQEEVRRLEGAMKSSSEAVKAARKSEQDLARQVKESKRETKSLTDESKGLTEQGDKLKQTIDRDKESLSRMTAELKAAGIDTRNLTSEQARLTQQSQRMAEAQERYKRSKAALDQTKQNLSWNNIKGELMTAAGLGYALYKPVSQSADFESAMARVNAVAFSGAGRDKEADAKSFKALSEQARQLGRDTQFTAVQAAQSQENLARAGFKADEIIAAMPGLLNMAAAEGMDLATASDVAASTLRGFQLSADQANRVADVLAQTSAASNTNIVGLGEGMKYVAPVAANLGVSLEETSAMLGVMANAGIKGTEGGTALRGAFLRLAQEPKAVAKALATLGVASRDAQGNMRKLPDIMTELAAKMKNMGDADKMQKLADIFGVRAVSGMMAVMSGVADGSLETITQYNKEATGILKAMSEATGASLDEMRVAMKGVEPYTEKLGISYRDLAIYTAMLAKSGATGVIANQQLMATFSALANNSKRVQKSLKAYGISLVDDKGNTRDFLEILKDLNNAMKGMDGKKQLEALQKIFKDDEAVLGIQALMAQFDKGAYFELDKVKTKGVSAEMAEKLLETYSGQMTLLGSATGGLMIDIGDVLLPMSKEIVRTITAWTSGLSKLAQEHPEITKAIVGTVGALAALKVGFVGLKIGWNLLKFPFQSLKVAIDFVNLKILAHGKKVGLLSKVWGGLKSGAIGIGHAFQAVGKGIWGVFKGIGKGVFDVGKLALYKAKTVAITIATKAWTAAQWLWNVAMNAGRGLLNVGKLILYGAKSALVATAKGAWTAAEWLWIAAMRAGRGLLDVGRLALYYAKNIAIGIATKAWSIAQGLLNIALKPFNGLLSVGKLALYYAKSIAISIATKAWTAAQWVWNAAMNANPIGLLITAIAGLVVAGYYLYKNWDYVCTWWGNTWEWLGSEATNIIESLKGVFSSIGEWASEYFKLDFSGMWDGLKSSLNSVRDMFANWGKTIKSLFTLDFSGACENFLATLESIKGIFGGIVDVITSLFNIDVSRVTEGIKSAFGGVSEIISGIRETIAGIFKLDFSGIWDGFVKVWNGAFETISGIGKTFAGLFNIDFSGMWDGFMSGFDKACSYISEGLSKVTGWIGGGLSSAWNWTAGLFGYGDDTPEAQQKQLQVQVQDVTVLNKMSEGFSQRVAEMTQAWQPFKDSLGESFTQIYTAMQGVSDKIRGVVIPAVNELVSALSRVATEISAIVQAGNIEVDVRTPNQGMGSNVPQQFQRTFGGRKRAEGGFITQPEIALIGEAGREVVIPLEKQARGTELWLQAGRELGLIANTSITNNSPVQNTEGYNALPQIVNAMKIQPQVSNVIPHATGGIFTQPHIGLVAEAGSEAIIPLEDKSRGLPLWMAAGEELGFSLGGSSTNSNMSFTFNPTVSVTVNGGDSDSESKFRRILSEMFEELFLDFQERMQRVAFE